jgi:hypothetical protein
MEVSEIASDPPNSLERINAASRMCGRVINVGRVATPLPDNRAISGLESGAVLDVSQAACAPAQARLHVEVTQVDRLVEKRIPSAELRRCDSWQDQPSCCFSTNPTDRRKDVDGVSRAARLSSRVIITTSALDGPRQCHGSQVYRVDASVWHRNLGTREDGMRA